jgi:hypothetical protein
MDSCSRAISTESNPQALNCLKRDVLSFVNGGKQECEFKSHADTSIRVIRRSTMTTDGKDLNAVKKCDDTRESIEDKVKNSESDPLECLQDFVLLVP